MTELPKEPPQSLIEQVEDNFMNMQGSKGPDLLEAGNSSWACIVFAGKVPCSLRFFWGGKRGTKKSTESYKGEGR